MKSYRAPLELIENPSTNPIVTVSFVVIEFAHLANRFTMHEEWNDLFICYCFSSPPPPRLLSLSLSLGRFHVCLYSVGWVKQRHEIAIVAVFFIVVVETIYIHIAHVVADTATV